MAIFNYAQRQHILPVLAPQDITSAATGTTVVNFANYHSGEFVLNMGSINNATCVVTLEECSNNTPTTTAAIAFNYRLTSATGTDSTGAVTTATTSGVTIAAADDNKTLIVDVDPNTFTASTAYTRARLKITPDGAMSNMLVSCSVILNPRYPQAIQINALD